MKKIIITVGVLIALIGAGVYYFYGSDTAGDDWSWEFAVNTENSIMFTQEQLDCVDSSDPYDVFYSIKDAGTIIWYTPFAGETGSFSFWKYANGYSNDLTEITAGISYTVTVESAVTFNIEKC